MVPEFPCGSLVVKGGNFRPSRTCHLPGSTREWGLLAKTHRSPSGRNGTSTSRRFPRGICRSSSLCRCKSVTVNTENSPALADQHVPPHTSKTTHEETTSTPTERKTRRYSLQTRQPPDRLYGTMNYSIGEIKTKKGGMWCIVYWHVAIVVNEKGSGDKIGT